MAIRTGNGYSNLIYGTNYGDSLYGLGGNDTLYGFAGNDLLSGGTGNDKLDGGSGFDDLYGGSGNDRMAGGTSSDYLSGGSGNDTLLGGTGNDELVGGTGVDVFQFNYANGSDIIYDFDTGIDYLDVRGTGAIDEFDLLFRDVYVSGVLSTQINYGSGVVTLVGVDQDEFYFSNYDDIIFA
jgi:Ca2+-binding RTX toxin-like protein